MKTNDPKIVLKNVEDLIAKLEDEVERYKGYGSRHHRASVYIRDVYESLGIFDWWKPYLSLSQLKQMRSFLKTSIEYGYDGYVCFKVGAAGCSHGMWANKEKSTTGYSPDNGGELFHSFRSEDDYWCIKDDDGQWLKKKQNESYFENQCFTTRELKAILNKKKGI